MLGSSLSLISRAVLAADVQFDNAGSLDLVAVAWPFIFFGHGAERARANAKSEH